MKIAVYSGTFNPLHIGHLAILEFLTEDKDFDMTYLIVSPKNPLKDTISADSGRDRFNAAVTAVKRHPGLKVKVDDIELGMTPPQYTIKTLDALKQREPENDFTLIIGADNLAALRKWREWGRILTDYGVAVYPREGYDINKLAEEFSNESPAYRITVLDAPEVDISSSEIRSAAASGKDMSGFLM